MIAASRRSCARALWLFAAALGACATPPPAQVVAPPAAPAIAAPAPTALPPSAPAPVEYPPPEPVELPLPRPAAATPPASAAVPEPAASSRAATATPTAPADATPAVETPAPAAAAPVAPAEPSDEQLMAAVVADLQRYAQLGPDELRREVTVVTQLLARQRSDANRVRLAVLYTMVRTPQDDQRALQLFDNVARSGPGSPAVKQLAVVLQVQVAERARAVREEQQKADSAVQKLEALRAMERSLLRDRVRSGGGGGGGGGGSGN